MKGTMSELELSLFRQRSQEALKQKARRGALFLGVAAGYLKSGRDRIDKDPTCECGRPCGRCSRNSPSFAAPVKFISGCERKAFCCPPSRGDPRRSASSGNCPPTMPSTTY